jgi:hypothetical protein
LFNSIHFFSLFIRSFTFIGSFRQELVVCLGDNLQDIVAEAAAIRVADFLKLDKHSMKDPPIVTVEKCKQFCMFLKSEGRNDIVEGLRIKLPSGMTGQ